MVEEAGSSTIGALIVPLAEAKAVIAPPLLSKRELPALAPDAPIVFVPELKVIEPMFWVLESIVMVLTAALVNMAVSALVKIEVDPGDEDPSQLDPTLQFPVAPEPQVIVAACSAGDAVISEIAKIA